MVFVSYIEFMKLDMRICFRILIKVYSAMILRLEWFLACKYNATRIVLELFTMQKVVNLVKYEDRKKAQ